MPACASAKAESNSKHPPTNVCICQTFLLPGGALLRHILDFIDLRKFNSFSRQPVICTGLNLYSTAKYLAPILSRESIGVFTAGVLCIINAMSSLCTLQNQQFVSIDWFLTYVRSAIYLCLDSANGRI